MEIKYNSESHEASKLLAERKYIDEQLFQIYTSIPMGELGLSTEEQIIQAKVEEDFIKAAENTQGSNAQFLDVLRSRGVNIIKDSRVLDAYTKAMIKIDKTGADAMYVTEEDIRKFIESGIDKFSEEVKKELSEIQNCKVGAIFLKENPTPLTVWHEGVHALQSIVGWPIGGNTNKALTEVGVDVALIKVFQKGLLKDVTKGEYRIDNEGYIVSTKNDIYSVFDDLDIDLKPNS